MDFPVQLSWQTGNTVRRAAARCIDLSASGAKLETKEQLSAGTTVLVMSQHFGRLGTAAVKYCNRVTMDYEIGIFFSAALQLSDPARRKIMEGLIRKPAVIEVEATPEPERARAFVLR